MTLEWRWLLPDKMVGLSVTWSSWSVAQTGTIPGVISIKRVFRWWSSHSLIFNHIVRLFIFYSPVTVKLIVWIVLASVGRVFFNVNSLSKFHNVPEQGVWIAIPVIRVSEGIGGVVNLIN